MHAAVSLAAAQPILLVSACGILLTATPLPQRCALLASVPLPDWCEKLAAEAEYYSLVQYVSASTRAGSCKPTLMDSTPPIHPDKMPGLAAASSCRRYVS